MKKFKLLKDARFLLPASFLLVSCGGALDSSFNTSQDGYLIREANASEGYDSLSALIHDQDQNPQIQEPAKEAPTPMGRRRHPINGVAYVISRELSDDDDSPADFPELRSSFDKDDNGSKWRPGRGYDIPVVRNAKVERWVRTFTGPLRSNYERWLGRASRYAPMIERVLHSYGLPNDLIYLAMIESGFNLNAYSRAAAAGPWQFIRSTGHLYGLKSGGFVDERRDIEKATRAAAEHLRDLYARYGDWNLAFAAYNAGPGKVDRAIRLSGTRDYWKMISGRHHYFRRETEEYVPRIYAAAIIAKHYREYGFSSDVFNEPYNVETASVPDATDLSAIAKCAEVSVEDIRLLNPSLVMGMTPPGQSYKVILPQGTAKLFEKNYAFLPVEERVQTVTHRVGRNETLATIARRYGVTRTLLAKANNLSTTSRLRAGASLVVPRKRTVASSSASQPASAPLVTLVSASAGTVSTEGIPDDQKIIHSVRRGDTLWGVSVKYRVTVTQLKQWNSLRSNKLRLNQKLVIYAAQGGIRKVATLVP